MGIKHGVRNIQNVLYLRGKPLIHVKIKRNKGRKIVSVRFFCPKHLSFCLQRIRSMFLVKSYLI